MPRAWTRRFVTQQGPQFARTEGLFFSCAATRDDQAHSGRQSSFQYVIAWTCKLARGRIHSRSSSHLRNAKVLVSGTWSGWRARCPGKVPACAFHAGTAARLRQSRSTLCRLRSRGPIALSISAPRVPWNPARDDVKRDSTDSSCPRTRTAQAFWSPRGREMKHAVLPRILRAGEAPGYLGMSRQVFDREVRPRLRVIDIGKKGKGVDRAQLDAIADEWFRDERSHLQETSIDPSTHLFAH